MTDWLTEWVSYAIKTRDAYASKNWSGTFKYNLCPIAKNTLYLLFRDKNNLIFVKMCLTVPILTGCAWEPGSRFPLFVEVCVVSNLEAEIEDEDESEAYLLSLPLSPVTQLSILGWKYSIYDDHYPTFIHWWEFIFVGFNNWAYNGRYRLVPILFSDNTPIWPSQFWHKFKQGGRGFLSAKLISLSLKKHSIAYKMYSQCS